MVKVFRVAADAARELPENPEWIVRTIMVCSVFCSLLGLCREFFVFGLCFSFRCLLYMFRPSLLDCFMSVVRIVCFDFRFSCLHGFRFQRFSFRDKQKTKAKTTQHPNRPWSVALVWQQVVSAGGTAVFFRRACQRL